MRVAGRAAHHLDGGDGRQLAHDGLDELPPLRRPVNHLPVARHDGHPPSHWHTWPAHAPLPSSPVAAPASRSAATPGSSRPSRNSSEAPPPVETCVIFADAPACSTAAAESPPPTMVTAPCSVRSASKPISALA